ncbi:MAG: FAD-dependent monooxygenase [Acholeplasmatales bacterium]|jgi:uncharacterized FAD-dependent dehydrogenase|nr:FAD-dependent monooxygenase [Acholeplasmatales bacterium]
MTYILYNLKVDKNLLENELKDYILREIKEKNTSIHNISINKKSIDTRKGKGTYIYSVIFQADNLLNETNNLKKYVKEEISLGLLPKKDYLVVGMGPAGLFLSLFLLYRGIKVTIIERGKKIEDRIKDIKTLDELGILNLDSNNLFGEGGAGTFSDGKLQTGIKSIYIKTILNELVKFGADKNILTDSNPHIGTDKLRIIIVNIRNYLLENGVTIHFSTKFIDYKLDNQKILVEAISNNKIVSFTSHYLILAFGTADKRNYEILQKNNIILKPKDFSIGLRIEHLRSEVDNELNKNSNLTLESRSYKYFAHLEMERTCYTFCMCPGGEVIKTPNEIDTMVVNGMSYSARDSINSNSALLVNVRVADYYLNNSLDGFTFRENIEKKAFNKLTPYSAPVQTVGSFLDKNYPNEIKNIRPSISSYYFADFDEILPYFISSNIKKGILEISKLFKVYKNKDAILTGVETRSSSPVMVSRQENYTLNDKYVYVIGDGSGYSGGITSAIVDAIKLVVLL